MAGCLVGLFKTELVFWKRRAPSHECSQRVCKSCGLQLLSIFLVHPFVSGVPSINSHLSPNKVLTKLWSWWKRWKVRKSGAGGKKKHFFSANSPSPVICSFFVRHLIHLPEGKNCCSGCHVRTEILNSNFRAGLYSATFKRCEPTNHPLETTEFNEKQQLS